MLLTEVNVVWRMYEVIPFKSEQATNQERIKQKKEYYLGNCYSFNWLFTYQSFMLVPFFEL